MEEKYKSKYCSPNEYTHIGILTIPGGDHRVKIINVVEKQYGNTSLQALEITLIGMGTVFFFLLVMICILNILRICTVSDKKDLSKIAAAIALIKSKE